MPRPPLRRASPTSPSTSARPRARPCSSTSTSRSQPGEFVCLLGASGCGKSTLLSLIAGLDKPVSGAVEVPGGRPALMFQEPALYPWLSAGANVELALRLRGVPRKERKAEARRLLSLVRLDGAAPKRVARAVRRHAPARRARSRPRPGGRPAAHGRAVRRARRHHARRAARGAHPHLVRDRSGGDLRDAQRPRGGPARAARRPAVVATRPGGARVARGHPAAATHRGP